MGLLKLGNFCWQHEVLSVAANWNDWGNFKQDGLGSGETLMSKWQERSEN